MRLKLHNGPVYYLNPIYYEQEMLFDNINVKIKFSFYEYSLQIHQGITTLIKFTHNPF